MSKKELNKELSEGLEMADLWGFTTTITSIKCNNCGKSEKIEGEEFETIDYFYESGWRVINNKCLCEKCLKVKN